jgi:hypothetical protein
MHAIPSTGDAKTIWHAVQAPGTPAAIKIVAVPIVGIIYLGAVGSFFWLDLIYGCALAMLVPKLLIALLA